MNYDQVHTFLAVVSYGSITSASEILFVSQSTVSNRILALETEIGERLLIRNKGHKTVELTNYGKHFVPIAEQWSSLYQSSQALRLAGDIRMLTIASVDVINNCTFTELYKSHMKKYPRTKLSVLTFHSGEIHRLIENRTADIGYVFQEINYQNILSKPVYRELMYLMFRKGSPYEDGISCLDLKRENEVFLNWGPDYLRWHNSMWDPDKYPLITVNTGNMLQHYLQDPESWAIVPMSVIESLKSDPEIRWCRLRESPPPRICYQLTSRYANASRADAIREFEEEMLEFVRSDSSICKYENWMSGSQE